MFSWYERVSWWQSFLNIVGIINSTLPHTKETREFCITLLLQRGGVYYFGFILLIISFNICQVDKYESIKALQHWDSEGHLCFFVCLFIGDSHYISCKQSVEPIVRPDHKFTFKVVVVMLLCLCSQWTSLVWKK